MTIPQRRAWGRITGRNRESERREARRRKILSTANPVDLKGGDRIAAVRLGLIPKLDDRGRGLRRRYGLDPTDYQRMLDAQDGKCAICGRTWHTFLYVDHNHRTGKNRGLLCAYCNTAVSYADNIGMTEIIEYLVKYDPDWSTINGRESKSQDPDDVRDTWNSLPLSGG